MGECLNNLANQMARFDWNNETNFSNSNSILDTSTMNQTCPAAISVPSPKDSTDTEQKNTWNEMYNADPFQEQDRVFREQLRTIVQSAVVNQDSNMIPDGIRELIMRQKRKDEAYKTALCDSYRRTQTCAYGSNCRFAHGVDELRLAQPRGRNHPKYKTVLCENFSKSGYCKYGQRCQFIHKFVNPQQESAGQRSFIQPRAPVNSNNHNQTFSVDANLRNVRHVRFNDQSMIHY